jgi:hypothetical protein
MKKTLLFSVIIGMYVLLCGCPYEYTDTTKVSAPTPSVAITKTHQVTSLGTVGNPVTLQGQSYIGTFYNLTFNLTTPTGTQYTLLVQDTSKDPLVGMKTTLCYCYFYDTAIGTKNNTIMEVLQPTNPGDTLFNHMFSLVSFDASGNLTSILPFPTPFQNYQLPGSPHPTSYLQYMGGYISYCARVASGGDGPALSYPPNTAAGGGYDDDALIKGIGLVGASGSTGSTGATGGTGGGGMAYTWGTIIIYLIVIAIVMLIMGLTIGRKLGKNMTKK